MVVIDNENLRMLCCIQEWDSGWLCNFPSCSMGGRMCVCMYYICISVPWELLHCCLGDRKFSISSGSSGDSAVSVFLLCYCVVFLNLPSVVVSDVHFGWCQSGLCLQMLLLTRIPVMWGTVGVTAQLFHSSEHWTVETAWHW